MIKENLHECPVCERDLTITEYQCKKCGTVIKGQFKQDKFAQLSQEQRDFIEIFVMKRGSIKDIEKELGISYPTVRNKLDDVISAMGHKIDKAQSKVEILNLLNSGEINSEEAAKMLEDLK